MLDQVEEIASDEGLQQAYRWLCTRRTDYAPDNDVWRLRWRGDEVKPQIQAALRTGTYRLGAVDCFRREGQTTEVWAARDALVLKATALVTGVKGGVCNAYFERHGLVSLTAAHDQLRQSSRR